MQSTSTVAPIVSHTPFLSLESMETAGTTPGASAADDRWVQVSPNGDEGPLPCSGTSEVLYGRTLYIFGGYRDNQALDEMWGFDLDLSKWRRISQAGELPLPRTSHSLVLDSDNARIYCIAGSGDVFGSTNMGDVFEFDILLQFWRRLEFTGDILAPRYGQSAVLADNKILVFGGTFGRAFCNDMHSFDLKTMVCTRIPTQGDVPCERYKHAVGMYYPSHGGPRMLLHGGATNRYYSLNDTYIYHVHSMRWERISCAGNPPPGQFAHTLVVSNTQNCAYMYGGSDKQSIFGEMFRLDLETMHWECISKSTGMIPRYFHGCVLDDDYNQLFVLFGKSSVTNPDRLNDIHRFIPKIRVSNPTPECTLPSDMMNLLNSQEISDMHLVSSDNDLFPCHSKILQCRTKLPLTNLITVQASSVAASYFLKFIYSENLDAREWNPRVTLELLILAHLAQLPRLIMKTEIWISQNAQRVCQQVSSPELESAPLSTDVKEFLQRFHDVHNNSDIIPYRNSSKSIVNRIRRFKATSSSLGRDLLRLRDQSPFDFQLTIQHAVFNVHLLILSARCNFFRSSALQYMCEGHTRSCQLESSVFKDADTLNLILDYIYGGEYAYALEPNEYNSLQPHLKQSDLSRFLGFSNQHFTSLSSDSSKREAPTPHTVMQFFQFSSLLNF